jgi:hypothetical protein
MISQVPLHILKTETTYSLAKSMTKSPYGSSAPSPFPFPLSYLFPFHLLLIVSHHLSGH